MLQRLFQFLIWSAGYLALDLFRTVRKVKGRESLDRPDVEGLESVEVVRSCLQACLEERRVGPRQTATVLCAGFRHFREPWARDFGFASYGLIAEGRADVVEDGVRLFFSHQKSTGQLPLKLHSTVLIERYLHSLFARVQPVDANLIPRFITAHGTRSLDSVLLLIIAWGECVLHTENEQLAVDLHGQVLRALAWIDRYKGSDGLIHQGPFADWADSIGRKGAILYTNVLWWKALNIFEDVERHLPNHLAGLPEGSEPVGERIKKHFFKINEGYFYNTPSSPIFSSAGNFMAVAWGLADSDQSQSILDYAALRGLSTPVPTKVTDRKYPAYMIGPEMWLAGIPTYHTSCAWMWIGGWHAVACQKAGRAEEADDIVERMMSIVGRDRTVFEVHDETGEPLSTTFYHSEEPLSWNAAMILYAYDTVKGTARG